MLYAYLKFQEIIIDYINDLLNTIFFLPCLLNFTKADCFLGTMKLLDNYS